MEDILFRLSTSPNHDLQTSLSTSASCSTSTSVNISSKSSTTTTPTTSVIPSAKLSENAVNSTLTTSQTSATNHNSRDFVSKLYDMLDDPNDRNLVWWGKTGDSFVVLECESFTKHTLPKHFKHSNFSSFIRQLNKYDFHKVRYSVEDGARSPYGPNTWEFKHPDFRIDNRNGIDNIKRKHSSGRKSLAADKKLDQTQQIRSLTSQLELTQSELKLLQDRFNSLSQQHSALQKDFGEMRLNIADHSTVLGNIKNFLSIVDSRKFQDTESGSAHPSTTLVSPPENSKPELELPISNIGLSGSLLQCSTVNNSIGKTVPARFVLDFKNFESSNEIFTLSNDLPISTHEPTLSQLSPSSSPHPNCQPTIQQPQHPHPSMPQTYHSSMIPSHQSVSDAFPDVNIGLTSSNALSTISPPLLERRLSASIVRRKNFRPRWTRRPRILLVEDDPNSRRILSKFLLASGCFYEVATDGLEAVNRARARPSFDLILMDSIMPRLSGLLAGRFIRQFVSTPIVAMILSIRKEDVIYYMRHGMTDVLSKPFTRFELIQILDKHLRHLRKPDLELNRVTSSIVSVPSHNTSFNALRKSKAPEISLSGDSSNSTSTTAPVSTSSPIISSKNSRTTSTPTPSTSTTNPTTVSSTATTSTTATHSTASTESDSETHNTAPDASNTSANSNSTASLNSNPEVNSFHNLDLNNLSTLNATVFPQSSTGLLSSTLTTDALFSTDDFISSQYQVINTISCDNLVNNTIPEEGLSNFTVSDTISNQNNATIHRVYEIFESKENQSSVNALRE